MADITSASTIAGAVPASGGTKLVTITATLTSSVDTIVLTEASHGITGIDAIMGAVVTGGMDAAFSNIQASFSGLTVTVSSFEEDMTVATDFTGTTVAITLLGSID